MNHSASSSARGQDQYCPTCGNPLPHTAVVKDAASITIFEAMRHALALIISFGEPIRARNELWWDWRERVRAYHYAVLAVSIADKESE